MGKELVQTTGAKYLVSHSDSEVTKDIGKVLVGTGAGGLVLLGLASVFGFLAPLILLSFILVGGILWAKS